MKLTEQEGLRDETSNHKMNACCLKSFTQLLRTKIPNVHFYFNIFRSARSVVTMQICMHKFMYVCLDIFCYCYRIIAPLCNLMYSIWSQAAQLTIGRPPCSVSGLANVQKLWAQPTSIKYMSIVDKLDITFDITECSYHCIIFSYN